MLYLNEKKSTALTLRDKEYYFRVDEQRISEPIEPGMLVFSSDGQLVYVVGIIDDKTPEEEAQYTGVLTKIFAVDPVIKSGGRGIEPKKLSAIENAGGFRRFLILHFMLLNLAA
jgi:hypothetical protein